MSDVDREWDALRDAFNRFARHIEKVTTVNVNGVALRQEAQDVAEHYFRKAKPLLDRYAIEELRGTLDRAFEAILQLSQNKNATNSYRKQIRVTQRTMAKVSSHIVVNQASAPAKSEKATNDEDALIIDTLEKMVPSAALSYKQALVDMSDAKRVSFRGPALELREALRETLDHLAPDEQVKAANDFKLEKDQTKPTKKQKVRFIMKARGQSKSTSDIPEQTANMVDEMIVKLTTTIYDRSSFATHVSTEHKTVLQIKRYVATILHEILSL